MSQTNDRQNALQQWVARELEGTATLAPLPGDAGFRRYFTIEQAPQWLAVDAPPERENTPQFVAVARLLARHGVAVPELGAVDQERGFLLVAHWRDGLFGDRVEPDSAAVFYGEALFTLLSIQQIPAAETPLPAFDEAFIRRELGLFPEWFIGELLGLSLDEPERALLQSVFTRLVDSALEQPQCVMHRDYHSRNLVLRGTQLGVIDFQDAVIGPVTYDLVSLLRDCYLRLAPAQCERWARAYADMAVDAGVIDAPDGETFMRQFDWMGLQRHLKVLGIFARLHKRDGKDRYLADLPRVIGYVREVAGRYPEFAEFARWFDERLLPACRACDWYIDTVAEDLPEVCS